MPDEGTLSERQLHAMDENTQIDRLIQSLPYERLELTTRDAVADIFNTLRSHAPDARLYGFALCTDCDVRSFYWAANSAAMHQETAETWLRTTREKYPASAATLEQALWLYRYEVGDWGYHDHWLAAVGGNPGALASYSEAQDALGGIWDAWDASKPVPRDEEEEERLLFEYSAQVRSHCLNALAGGLRRFDQSFDWASLCDRNEFLLLVWVHDPDDPEEVRELARAVNPPPPFTEFSRQYHVVRGP
jgi:uncharacterized protein DUF4303